MRFKRVELSPNNKRQYLLALGRKDIELLLAEAINAKKHTPDVPETNETKSRLSSIVSGLKEALKVAEADGDEGYRVPQSERHKYEKAEVESPQLNRLEIIDHRECKTCHGKQWIVEKGKKPFECPACSGMGTKGREVIVGGPAYGQVADTVIDLQFQDKGKTLKILLTDKEKLQIGQAPESSRTGAEKLLDPSLKSVVEKINSAESFTELVEALLDRNPNEDLLWRATVCEHKNVTAQGRCADCHQQVEVEE